MREVEELGGLGDVDAARGAEQRLELLAGQRLGLRQEAEDAAAVVVDDDDADRRGDVAQGGEAAEVVQQAEVAGDDRGRPAAGVGGADPGGDQAVDAVGAAVAEEEGVGLARRQERLLVADRHARGRVDEVAVAVGAAEGEVQGGLGDLVAPASAASIASRAAALGLEPALPAPGAPRFSSRAAQPAASSVGSARSTAAARLVGSFQPP